MYNFDAKFNFFDILTESEEEQVLKSLFEFVHVAGDSYDVLGLVCKAWYRIRQDLGELDHW